MRLGSRMEQLYSCGKRGKRLETTLGSRMEQLYTCGKRGKNLETTLGLEPTFWIVPERSNKVRLS